MTTIKVINLNEEAHYLSEQLQQPDFMRDTHVSIGQGTLLENTFTEGTPKQIQQQYFSHISHRISTDEGHSTLEVINRLAREVKAGTTLALLTGQPAERCHGKVVQHLIEQAITRLPLQTQEQTAPSPITQEPAPHAQIAEAPAQEEPPQEDIPQEDTPHEVRESPAQETPELEPESSEPQDASGPLEPEIEAEEGESSPATEPTSEDAPQDAVEVEEPEDNSPVPSEFFQQLAALLKSGQTAFMMAKKEEDGELSVTFALKVDESNPHAAASPSVYIKLPALNLDDPETGFLKGLEGYRQERKTALASFKAASTNIKASVTTASKASKPQPGKKATTGKPADTKSTDTKGQDAKAATPEVAPDPLSQSPLFAAN